jgi:hypothetical protein
MNKLKIIIFMAGLFSWFTGCKGQSDNRNFEDEKFKAGQIWKYKTRTGEENSTVEILKVEKYDKSGIVVHIYVGGLKLKNPNKASGYSEEIGHLPLSKEAVLKSVTSLVSENNELTDFEDGYNNWKEAFDSNKGGIFSITIKEAVQYVEEAMSNAQKVTE